MPDLAATFDRSCSHWSEAKRAEMEAFYALAGRDYVELARAADWSALLSTAQREAGDAPLRLLDVACGSGKFPVALGAHAGVGEAGLAPIAYDLLDPSRFSLDEAASVLAPPFVAGERFETTLQDLPEVEPYDVVWATHALYALPEAELVDGMRAFAQAMGARAMGPRAMGARTTSGRGWGVVAHAAAASHYLRFDAAFREAFRGGEGEPYVSAEQVETAARAAGLSARRQVIRYDATSTDDAAVEGYLQRCAFDDTEDLGGMLDHPSTGAYLSACRDGGGWRFGQEVWLLWLSVA